MSVELLLAQAERLDWRVWRASNALDNAWECTLYRLGPADASLRTIVTGRGAAFTDALDAALQQAGGSAALLCSTRRLEDALEALADAILEAADDREPASPRPPVSDDL